MQANDSPKPNPTDAGHIPMTEELDSPKWSLPPIAPLLIAAVIVGIAVWAIVHFNRKPPEAQGQIISAAAVDLNGGTKVLASVQYRLVPSRDLWVSSMKVRLETPTGSYTDTPAPAGDVPRYTKSFPQLQPSGAEPASSNDKYKSGVEQNRFVVVSFPVSVDDFNRRKSLELTIHLRKADPVVLHQP